VVDVGFFDKVREVLRSSDAGRARKAPEESAPEAEQPAAEQPAAEQPAAEQPVAEQPVAEQEAADPHAAATADRTHTVVRGDTLAAIAEHYGVERQALAELNGIDNPDLIYPGQVFRVPHA
jgi:nucleoid-associated protein YgaU